MLLAGILGGSKPIRRYFFIFLELRKKSKKKISSKNRVFSEKIGILSGKIGIYRKNQRFFFDFFSSDFSTRKSFPAPPKTDFSPKNRSQKNDFFVHDCNSLCRDKLSRSQQTSKKMARELCRNNIFCVATQDLKIGR